MDGLDYPKNICEYRGTTYRTEKQPDGTYRAIPCAALAFLEKELAEKFLEEIGGDGTIIPFEVEI